MKVKTLSMMAGLGGALLMAAPSQAGFDGIVVENITMTNSGNEIPAGLHTIRIYAQFTDGADQLLGVVGSPTNPLHWEVMSGGTWWNSAIGGDTSPLFALEGAIPELGYDSYMTIGLSNADELGGLDATILAPGTDQSGLMGSTVWNGGAGGSMNVAWTVPPTDPNGDPTAQSVAGNWDGNRVLLAQMTIELTPGSDDLLVEGSMGILIQTGGENSEINAGFSYIPAPGALALLGLAGLAGTRRRRA